MGRLVPTEHINESHSLLDRRLGMPEGPYHDDYREVRKNLTDQVRHRGTSSKPVSSKELTTAAADPEGYLASKLFSNQAKQLAGSALAASAVSGLFEATGTVAAAAVSERSLSDLPWAEAARRAASGAVRSGSKALLGQSISLAAQHAVSTGAISIMESAAGATLPFAMAESTIEIAAIAHATATGRLSKIEAASAAAESIVRTTAIWGCAAMGQIMLPVPVLGSAVGGIVGQYGTVLLVQGIQLAIAARDESARWDTEYEDLLRLLGDLQESAAHELGLLRQELEDYDTVFTASVLPLLAEVSSTIGSGNPDSTLDKLASISRSFGGKPVFSTLAEFDAFMDDPDSLLNLRLSTPQPPEA